MHLDSTKLPTVVQNTEVDVNHVSQETQAPMKDEVKAASPPQDISELQEVDEGGSHGPI